MSPDAQWVSWSTPFASSGTSTPRYSSIFSAHALRQVAQLDASVDDVLLELEAEDDVHPVRDLVGADSDERRAHAVDGGIEAIELDAAELLREDLLQARIEEAPERHAASDEVLPQAALRLVQAERGAGADRKIREAARDLVLVQPVPVLVHSREQRLEAVLVVVRGDADVVDAGTACERMLGRIDAPRVGPVAEQIDDLVIESNLPVEREVAEEKRVVDLPVARTRRSAARARP